MWAAPEIKSLTWLHQSNYREWRLNSRRLINGKTDSGHLANITRVYTGKTLHLWIQSLIYFLDPRPFSIRFSPRTSSYGSTFYSKFNFWHSLGRAFLGYVRRGFVRLERAYQLHRLVERSNQVRSIAAVREYVAVYSNSQRLHSTLGYKAPLNYEET